MFSRVSKRSSESKSLPSFGSESAPHEHAHGGHSHDLKGASGASASVRKALVIALVLNGIFLVVEVAVGLWTNSLALLSDAVHMVSDVAALALALGASALASRAADSERTFGLVRAEALGAFVNGMALLVTCGFIFRESIIRLTGETHEVVGLPVLFAGVVGLLVNLGSAWMLAQADRGNLNIRGALLHMLSDALGSVGAIVAALFVMRGVHAADAVVSFLIGLLVCLGTWGLVRDSAGVLLEFSPKGVSVGEIGEQLLHLKEVEGVHDLHVWSLDGKTPIVSAHLIHREAGNPVDLLHDAECLLRLQFGVLHSTLQVESPHAKPCRAKDKCNLLPPQAGDEKVA